MADDKTNTKIDFGRNPFELTRHENHAVLKLIGDMGGDFAKEFEKRMRPDLDDLGLDLIIDLTETGNFHSNWTRILMQFVAQSKQTGKHVTFISTSMVHRAFFHEKGIAASLPLSSSMDAALQYLTAKRNVKLDVNVVNTFLEGTVDVLRVQGHAMAKPSNPTARDVSSPNEDYSAGLSFTSNTFSGSFVIGFPRATYLRLLSLMSGKELFEVSPEHGERVVELANTIAAYTKRIAKEKIVGLRITTAISLNAPVPNFEGKTAVIDKAGAEKSAETAEKAEASTSTEKPEASEKTEKPEKAETAEKTEKAEKKPAAEKAPLFEKTGTFEKTGVIDRNLTLFKPSKRIVVPFESDAGPFVIEIRF